MKTNMHTVADTVSNFNPLTWLVSPSLLELRNLSTAEEAAEVLTAPLQFFVTMSTYLSYYGAPPNNENVQYKKFQGQVVPGVPQFNCSSAAICGKRFMDHSNRSHGGVGHSLIHPSQLRCIALVGCGTWLGKTAKLGSTKSKGSQLHQSPGLG